MNPGKIVPAVADRAAIDLRHRLGLGAGQAGVTVRAGGAGRHIGLHVREQRRGSSICPSFSPSRASHLAITALATSASFAGRQRRPVERALIPQRTDGEAGLIDPG